MENVGSGAPGKPTFSMINSGRAGGLGLVLGNLLGGRFADRRLMLSLYVLLGGLAVVLAVFTVTATAPVPAAVTLFLLGGFGFATVPPLQMRVLDSAAAAPTIASAVNIGAFNLGNALAAWLGGLVISAGLGYTAPNWVGALMAAGALLLAVVAGRMDRVRLSPVQDLISAASDDHLPSSARGTTASSSRRR